MAAKTCPSTAASAVTSLSSATCQAAWPSVIVRGLHGAARRGRVEPIALDDRRRDRRPDGRGGPHDGTGVATEAHDRAIGQGREHPSAATAAGTNGDGAAAGAFHNGVASGRAARFDDLVAGDEQPAVHDHRWQRGMTGRANKSAAG